MIPPIKNAAAIATLRALVAELESRLSHPEHYSERERQHQKSLLQTRRLELADLMDQENDPGDLP